MCAKIALSRRMKRCNQRLTELTFQTLHITELVTFMRVTLPKYLPRRYSYSPPIRCLIFAGPTRSYTAWRS
jgi:hypothetical protein